MKNRKLNLMLHLRGCLTRYVSNNIVRLFNWRRRNRAVRNSPVVPAMVSRKQEIECCNHDCNQGRTCPRRKVNMEHKDHFAETIKRWGIAFLIGATVGLIYGQNRTFAQIEKDCLVLNSFRINETAFNCKFTTK